ncbi:substrate-binding domain-containing protein [Aurantimonas marina]|uniref:substrate-binding domain-containing protein n=1 Tax=Aurantimonas marina TaxID=2780508 RepID=UPI0019D0606A|nr:substrate-binding domain-containing protein [Aurantimonas marina]
MRLNIFPIVSLSTIIAATTLAGIALAQAETVRIGGTGGALGGMRLLGASFMKEHPATQIEVLPSLGSSGGIKALLAGAVDIAVSSRALKDEERTAGATSRLYARTPLAVVTSPDAPIAEITPGELAAIYAGETTRWPDGTIIRLVLRPASETDIQLLRQLSPGMERAVDVAFGRPGLVSATNDQDNAEALERLPGAIGLIAIGQIATEGRRLKVLSLDGVMPTAVLAAQADYDFVKDLHLVTKSDTTTPAMAFVAFVNSAEGQNILANTGHSPMAE